MAVMDRRMIVICQLGGVFEISMDGSLLYKGGDAHAVDITSKMKFDEFKAEILEIFNCTGHSLSFKYFLPGNRKTLITVSNDKDLQRMLRFHGDSLNVEVYITIDDVAPNDGSNHPTSKSSRTTLSDVLHPADSTNDTVVPESNLHNYMANTTRVNVSMMAPQEQVENSADNYDEEDELVGIPGVGSNPRSFSDLSIPCVQNCSRAVQYWQNTITGVGQRFNGVLEFRETLRRYAISHQFAFKYKKNDNNRVTVKCKAEGCPWRIHASKLSTTQLICIKKMNSTHTCNGAARTTGYQATRNWVASIIKEKLKVSPQYKPKDIINDIKQEYGIKINYFQAWRGKEIAKEQLVGSFTAAYSQLPIFCEKILEANPGSYTAVAIKDDSSFQSLFVSLRASLVGFRQGCRPLLFLDSISLASKYQETLLSATAADGDDKVFPIAFAIVDAETVDNWQWFLNQLKNALGVCDPLTFVADREKGLKESIPAIFPGSFHGYCLRCLSQQLMREIKMSFSIEVKRILISKLYSAACALRPEEFDGYLDCIKKISPEAYLRIQQSEPSNWANFLFQGARFNLMDSKFGEGFYSWASDAHELPITQLCDTIQIKIMDLIFMHRVESDQWLTRLTPSMEDKLHKESLNGRNAVVLNRTGNRFQVQDDDTVAEVDLKQWTCSCQEWQLTGMPCRHALNAIAFIGANPYEHCSRYFTIENYRITYADSVFPISDITRPSIKVNDSSQAPVIMNPPPTRSMADRLGTKNPTQLDPFKRELRCSKCKGIGHNKKTCKE